jgi:serine/threonine-protein kinase RsbT
MSAVMDVAVPGVVGIADEPDLLRVRTVLRQHAVAAGFGIVDQTKLVTAGSELARNILRYANGTQAELRVEMVHANDGRTGLRAIFSDQGPGIEDLDAALGDGYSTGGTLGLGLPGARRLVDEFAIDTAPGAGTRVTIVKWQR